MSTEQFAEITQELLRFSPDALVVVDDAGRIQFANETVKELFGYSPADLIGKPVELLVPEHLHERHVQHTAAYKRAPRGREMGAHITDLAARRADGSEFSAGIRLAPFRIQERLFIAAAIRDMTERRQINEALIAAREEADRANRAKSRFLATASHDLRQPLQAIRLLNAALLKMSADVQFSTLLERQSQAIDSMTRLLNGLLDISRLESGAIEPVLVEVRVNDLLDELRSEFEPVVHSRGLELLIHSDHTVLNTDRVLFRQLLENLLGNAVKYTDKGRIEVTTQMQDTGLVIVIADTGMGIPEDKIGRIFDEYYQVDASGHRRAGVGLGLAIVREVTRLLGYQLQISSVMGEGTRVELRVPQAAIVNTVTPLSASIPAVISVDSLKPRLVLVEDNDAVRMATELFLKLEGYEVISAAGIAEVEAQMHLLHGGNVLVADYHLDDQHTGLDLLATLRRHLGVDMPVVILSGDLPSVLRSLKTPLVNSRFLSKPVDTSALLAAITELSQPGVATNNP